MGINLSKFSTPGAAAKAFHQFLQSYAREAGGSSNEVVLWSPEEANKRGYGNSWSVCWEGGDYEWAINASMDEMPGVKMTGASGWFAEPYNSFILCFAKT